MDGDCMAMGEEEGLSCGKVTTINIGGGIVKYSSGSEELGGGETWRINGGPIGIAPGCTTAT
jgi:hypothetical protein